MPSSLKDFFNSQMVAEIARDLRRAHRPFPVPAFQSTCLEGLDQLELLARGWHLADALKKHLPSDFPAAVEVLLRSLGPELGTTESNGMAPFRYLPHVFFVARYGLDHFEPSMQAQYELTKRFSCEYSIRAFLLQYPQEAYERLREWASDPNVHVRRLVSEGTRPRLPWAPRLREFQKDPAPVIALLELLKDDPDLYVRRSVANSLNDIGKDHPKLAIDVCRRWWDGASAERRWIVRHALRSLVKKGDAGALALLGFAGAPKVRIENPRFSPKRLRIGGTLELSFDLESQSKKAQTLLVDFAVHFVKANGKSAPKVFKLRSVELDPGARASLAARVSFKQLTTRKHYPGVHRIEALVNGVAFPLGEASLDR
jgi:3-methyladenine DNA glycosylase AlkC